MGNNLIGHLTLSMLVCPESIISLLSLKLKMEVPCSYETYVYIHPNDDRIVTTMENKMVS
jgi:hypothetical protein